MKLKVVVEKGEDGFFVAHCPVLKGCWTQGKTEKQTLERLKEAIGLYLEADPAEKKTRPEHKVVSLSI